MQEGRELWEEGLWGWEMQNHRKEIAWLEDFTTRSGNTIQQKRKAIGNSGENKELCKKAKVQIWSRLHSGKNVKQAIAYEEKRNYLALIGHSPLSGPAIVTLDL